MKNKFPCFSKVTKIIAFAVCLVSAVSANALASLPSPSSPAPTSGYPKIPINIIVLSAVAIPGASLSFPLTALLWNKFVASE